MTAEQRGKRERVRMVAADMFADGASNAQVAKRFRVSLMSVSRWRRAYTAAGPVGLASKGPPAGKLTDAQIGLLRQVLDAGPAAAGYLEDQRWTLARVGEVIRSRFGVGYSIGGVAYLLHRIGYTVQMPARRAAERDETAVTEWRNQRWPAVKGWRRTWARGCASTTKPAKGSGRRKRVPGAGADTLPR